MALRAKTPNAIEISDSARDVAFCGKSLAEDRVTRFVGQGAHDPAATPYFVLEELLGKLDLQEGSHLLDVGCGRGRALAYFVQAGLPGRITGVELDPSLSAQAFAWSKEYSRVEVAQGSVLELPLAQFTHFYLFNPFDSVVLVPFLEKIEKECANPVKVLHMSDNGETYYYLGKPGWQLLDQGEFQMHQGVQVYGCPQHWSLWSYERQEK